MCNSWIFVDVKIPDMPVNAEGFCVSDFVLVACSDGIISIANAAIWDADVEWATQEDTDIHNVTHWMSLPPHPILN